LLSAGYMPLSKLQPEQFLGFSDSDIEYKFIRNDSEFLFEEEPCIRWIIDKNAKNSSKACIICLIDNDNTSIIYSQPVGQYR